MLQSAADPPPRRLKDWGIAHRFAGSKDRAAIASLVFDALRKRASAIYVMGADDPRAIMLGALREARGQDAEAIAAFCSGAGHAPAPLSDEERQRLETASLADAPDHVRGDYPEWLASHFEAAFGGARGGRRRGARRPRACRSARQYSEMLARAGARKARASVARADAAFADRPAHRGGAGAGSGADG